jgi:hypothetical protein
MHAAFCLYDIKFCLTMHALTASYSSRAAIELEKAGFFIGSAQLELS